MKLEVFDDADSVEEVVELGDWGTTVVTEGCEVAADDGCCVVVVELVDDVVVVVGATVVVVGATVVVDPMDIPNTGRFAVLVDPQGAMFALFKG